MSCDASSTSAQDTGGRNAAMNMQAERGLLGLVTVGGEARQQVDEEVVGAAVAGVRGSHRHY
ncbi:MAG: hypothetical protein C5B60_04395 [Chloroflexi bacterium]|nr:MAG: hypothetical protein C5B60_04395 [Chloroflexota bacterium]